MDKEMFLRAASQWYDAKVYGVTYQQISKNVYRPIGEPYNGFQENRSTI